MNDAIRVLVVEDDPPSLANLRLLLELEAFDVACATDGSSGLEEIRAGRPDIVICDILMPGMNGLSLLDEVRRDPEIAATPFIFLSALSDYEHLRQGMNRGADDYLVKPCSPADLLAAISARLNRLRQLEVPHGEADQDKSVALPADLTGREQEIFGLIGRGLSSRSIAGQLGISVRTVDSHRANIIAKFGLDSGAGLIRLAAVAQSERAVPLP